MGKGGGKFSLTEKDKGYKKFVKSAKDLAKTKPYVKAGILESAGMAEGDSGLSVAEVATFNEFGTEKTPERSFMRWVQATKKDEIVAFIKGLLLKPFYDPDQSLNLLGLKLVSLIQNRINQGPFEENAPSTVARKGSSRPLIDKGQMRNSVNHLVVKGGD